MEMPSRKIINILTGARATTLINRSQQIPRIMKPA